MSNSLYIHFGIGKTGTTAIQRFFLLNKKRLLKEKIYVPKTGMNKGEGFHHPLAFSLSGDKAKNNLYKNVESPEMYLGKMIKEIATVFESKILLTSEIFPACVLELKEFTNKVFNGYDINIVVYLRRHDHLYESTYIQMVKNGSEIREIDQFIKEKTRWPYLRFLGWLESEYKPVKMIVRPYEKNQLLNEDIVHDFLYHVFDLQIDASFKTIKGSLNPSLSRDAMEFKRIINKLGIDPKYNNVVNKYLLKYSEQQSGKSHERFIEKNMLSPKHKLKLIGENMNDYNEIAKKYCNKKTGSLFDESLPNMENKWEDYNDLSPKRVLDIVMQILSATYDNESIKQRINSSLVNLFVKDVQDGNIK